MESQTVTTRAELTIPQQYRVYDQDTARPVGKVVLLSVGETTAYGVDYDTGKRVKLQPIDEYLANGQLVSLSQDTSESEQAVQTTRSC